MINLPIVGSDAIYRLSPTKIVAVGLNYREHIQEGPTILKGRPLVPIPAETSAFSEDTQRAHRPRRIHRHTDELYRGRGFRRA